MTKRKRKIRRPAPSSRKEWWEEDFALPVLAIFGGGLFLVMRDMRAEAQARKAVAGSATATLEGLADVVAGWELTPRR